MGRTAEASIHYFELFPGSGVLVGSVFQAEAYFDFDD